MGLLDSLLEVPEHLRVWQMTGVRHFYIDPNAAAAARPDVPADSPAGGEPGGQPAATGPAASAILMDGPADAAGPQILARGSGTDLLPTRSEAATPASRPALPPHPGDWPAPWPALFAKAPARPRLVITYRELGLDLTGQADPRRGGLWRSLIRDLRLSGQNAVAFWPLALPRDGELVDAPEAFAAGLALFSPAVTAVFGPLPPAVAEALAARDDTAGLVIRRLPHPEELLQGDPEAWDHVCALLAVG